MIPTEHIKIWKDINDIISYTFLFSKNCWIGFHSFVVAVVVYCIRCIVLHKKLYNKKLYAFLNFITETYILHRSYYLFS